MVVERILSFQEDTVHSKGLLQFINCYVLRNHKLWKEDFWIEDRVIRNPEKVFFDERRAADIQIDCQGGIISPGFIDVQINGGFGYDFSSNSTHISESIDRVANGLLAHGVTSFVPTIVTSVPDVYHQVLPRVQCRNGSQLGAGVLGVHLEGPFICADKCGAHPKQHIISQIDDIFSVYGSHMDNVRIVTLAPELPGASKAVQQLSERGVRVSLGHSSANLLEGEAAVRVGATGITHLFNAMQPFHHRDPGLVGLLTSKYMPPGKTLFYGMIADGVHTHDSALRIAYKTHPEGLMLITDATAALGMGDGVHRLGDTVLEVKGRTACKPGTEIIVGSVSTMDYCVRHLLKAARCGVVDALECATLHPAQFLGIADRKGTLDYGSDADFLVLDQNLNVKATFIAGELVWCQK